LGFLVKGEKDQEKKARIPHTGRTEGEQNRLKGRRGNFNCGLWKKRKRTKIMGRTKGPVSNGAQGFGGHSTQGGMSWQQERCLDLQGYVGKIPGVRANRWSEGD